MIDHALPLLFIQCCQYLLSSDFDQFALLNDRLPQLFSLLLKLLALLHEAEHQPEERHRREEPGEYVPPFVGFDTLAPFARKDDNQDADNQPASRRADAEPKQRIPPVEHIRPLKRYSSAAAGAPKSDWWELVLVSAKQFFFGATFLGFAAYTLRWFENWSSRHADAELHIKQLELDIDRASWVVEVARDGGNSRVQNFRKSLWLSYRTTYSAKWTSPLATALTAGRRQCWARLA